jgi:hypothetical protein
MNTSNIDELKIQLEENEIPSDLIDEIIVNLKRDDGIVVPTSLSLDEKIFMLQTALKQETDFRKKAQIAARIISEKL